MIFKFYRLCHSNRWATEYYSNNTNDNKQTTNKAVERRSAGDMSATRGHLCGRRPPKSSCMWAAEGKLRGAGCRHQRAPQQLLPSPLSPLRLAFTSSSAFFRSSFLYPTEWPFPPSTLFSEWEAEEEMNEMWGKLVEEKEREGERRGQLLLSAHPLPSSWNCTSSLNCSPPCEALLLLCFLPLEAKAFRLRKICSWTKMPNRGVWSRKWPQDRVQLGEGGEKTEKVGFQPNTKQSNENIIKVDK